METIRDSNATPRAATSARGFHPLRWFSSGSRSARALKIAGAALLALGAGAAIAPWTVSRGALREEIAAQLRSSSGLYVYTTGASTFSLLPRPIVRLADIAFVDPRGALTIQAQELRGVVRLLPLLAGRLELSEATLERPSLAIDIDGRPMTSAGAAVRAADARPASPEAEKADRARLGVVTFVDGVAQLRRAGRVEETLSDIDARLDWRTVSAPAALDGAATWRGRRIALAVWIARPSDLLRGDLSSATAQMRGNDIELAANGALALGARPHFEGRIVASTPSARALFELAGANAPSFLGRGAASIDCECSASAAALSLSKVKATLGPNTFTGALALRFDEARPLLTGTLATGSLSMLSAFADAPRLIGADRHFSRDAFDPRPSDAIDLDLRLSASELSFARLRAQDVAGALMLKDGKLDLSIADARFYKGAAKARLAIEPREQGRYAVKASLLGRGVDWGAIDWDQFGHAHLSGAADVTLSLEGAGASPDQLARNLSGQGDIKLTNGEIIGLDVERVLKRMERRPLSTAADIRSGRTLFNSARATFEIENGSARVVDASVEGAGYAMTIAGAAQIPERLLSLRANVAPPDAARRNESPGFAFDIAGPWDNPVMTPDVQSFIRRSGAAQPLFGPPVAAPPVASPARE